jgi:hypothetical protein
MYPQPDYNIYPTLLDAWWKFQNTKLEDFFYQDEQGWHLNYNEADGTYHYSQEEMDALLEQELIDKINRVPTEPSEAASKGTIFNEIVDCINARHGTVVKDWFIASARGFNDFVEKVFGAKVNVNNENAVDSFVLMDKEQREIIEPYYATIARIGGKPFIYGSIDGFEFYFDAAFCKDIANYFRGAMCQYYTSAEIETRYGTVRLYGWIDELRKNMVYDLKTTKRYEFGNYAHYWQRHVYPYCLIESGDCKTIKGFEFTVIKWTGGTKYNPLLTGEMYKEYYTYDHCESSALIRQECERFIEWLEANKDKITDKKIFGEI